MRWNQEKKRQTFGQFVSRLSWLWPAAATVVVIIVAATYLLDDDGAVAVV